tara:strand:- start:232 stop:723 length:492 start_codon:yes stop_codon:yes gene_type:complete
METNKTHWRKFLNTAFLNGDEIPKEGVVVTIIGFEATEVYSQASKSKQEEGTLSFKELEKPMILTNRKAKQISAVVGSSFMEDWIGKTVTLFPVNEKHFGQVMPVINIKAGEHTKQVFNTKSPGWAKAEAAIKNGSTTIANIEKHYKLTDATKKILTDLIPKK